jgi:transcription elongation factor Elf1
MHIDTHSDMPSVRCDTCGQKASHMVRDLRQVAGLYQRFIQFRAVGRVRAGCEKHKQESQILGAFDVV